LGRYGRRRSLAITLPRPVPLHRRRRLMHRPREENPPGRCNSATAEEFALPVARPVVELFNCRRDSASEALELRNRVALRTFVSRLPFERRIHLLSAALMVVKSSFNSSLRHFSRMGDLKCSGSNPCKSWRWSSQPHS
jgi:hypothetical protein